MHERLVHPATTAAASTPGETSQVDRTKLKRLIIGSLKAQGFRVRGDEILPPRDLDKAKIRELHTTAVIHRIEVSREGLVRHEPRLLKRLASGAELDPANIRPRLIEVEPNSEDELLFRYAALHWSIPVSSGYGRRIRFLVVDEQNEKLIGLFGLGDPVFSLAARDRWVGWDKEMRRERLRNVMDAFVLGAVPPYSSLLCGKLVALLLTSREVRQAFRRKYGGAESVITRRPSDGQLALVATTSALGRSSLYSRVRYRERVLYESVGYTRGSGEFHFANGLYSALTSYAQLHCEPTAKHTAWGTGFRNRREVVRKALKELGLSAEWVYHGIQREVFVVPMAQNTQHFLRGEHSELQWFEQSTDDLFKWFRERWLLPRAARNCSYRDFDPPSYAIWNSAM
jgi:hypothetical protein